MNSFYSFENHANKNKLIETQNIVNENKLTNEQTKPHM